MSTAAARDSGDPSDPVSRTPTTFRPVVAVALVLAELGVLISVMTPAALTLALRIAEIFPETKGSALSVVLSAGALMVVIAGPLFGSLSDRTTARMGKRRPYLIVGLVGGPIGLLLMGLSEQLAVIAIGWCTVQLMMNASKTVILTGIYDFIPMSYRGRVSAFMGMTATFAPMIGTWLVQLVPTSALWMFLLPFFPAAALIIFLVVVMPDQPAVVDGSTGRLSPVGFVKSLWINPLRYPDFGWAALNRFLVSCGFATFMGYQTYKLIDNLGLASEDAGRTVALSTTIIAVSVVCAAVPTGWVSDKLDRRKVFVAGAGAVMGIGLLVIGFSASVGMFLVGASITGIGYGLWGAIDLALVTATLPTDGQAAKAMGFSTSMALVPQTLAPALAPAILAIGGGSNYPLLFIVAALFTIAGTLTIIPIRSVR